MERKNLYCDQAHCGQEASVFVLQPPTKIKACRVHGMDLMEKHLSVFSIAAYDFIESMEDYTEYVARREVEQKCQGTILALQERCEENRDQAKSQLHAVKQELLELVERCIREMELRVEQRCEQAKKELNTLKDSLAQFTSDKSYKLSPVLAGFGDSIPAGAVFRVALRDFSVSLAKAVMESCVLLPLDGCIPQMDIESNLLGNVKVLGEKADLVEKVLSFARELGHSVPSGDALRTNLQKSRRKAIRELLSALPLTATEQHKREIADSYLQAGITAQEAGNYAKSLKKLQQGWSLLQQFGLESPELDLQLGLVLARLGRCGEACEVLTRGRQRCSPVEMALRLSNGIVEANYLAEMREEAGKVAELALSSAAGCSNAFEQLKAVYFLADAQYQLDKETRGFELVSHWTNSISAETIQSKCALQLIHAEKKYREGSNKDAVRLYEEGLQGFDSLLSNSYLAVYSRHRLAQIYEAQGQNEVAELHFSQALRVYSIHFPQAYGHALCLKNLGMVYKSLGNKKAAETYYLKAKDLYLSQFPKSLGYAICLHNLAELYESMNCEKETKNYYLKAVDIYSAKFPKSVNYANCLTQFALFYKAIDREKAGESYYLRASDIYSSQSYNTLNHAICLHNLGDINISKNRKKAAKGYYLDAIDIYSAYFPQTLNYAICLNSLGEIYKSMNREKAGEANYLKSISIFAVHFPQHVEYGHCLANFGGLLRSAGRKAEAVHRLEAAMQVYALSNQQNLATRCELQLQELRNS